MKVAIVHPDLGIGGAERLVVDVAVALKSKKNQVLFVTNHFDKSHAFEELKGDEFLVKVIGDWIPRSLFGKFQALFAYLRMCFLTITYLLLHAKEDNVDVYFVDQIPMANFFLRLAGKKVIYYCHHPDLLATPHDSPIKKFYRYPIDLIEEYGTGLADVILVNSKYTAEVFAKTFPSIKKEICVLYPTISSSYEEMIKKKTARNVTDVVPELQNAGNPIVFLSVNRFHPAKQLELAIDAMGNLQDIISADDWNRVFLVMAGGYDPLSDTNKNYYNILLKQAESKNLLKKIIFMKSPVDSVKADLLLSCDCLIYTPINEHFGIVPLEAMAASKPVIACNSGGPCETVEHNVTGFLCQPTSEEIAKSMLIVLDKSKGSSMGAAGKKRLQKLFTYSAFAEATNKTFDVVYSST